jgi:hypothetical protein
LYCSANLLSAASAQRLTQAAQQTAQATGTSGLTLPFGAGAVSTPLTVNLPLALFIALAAATGLGAAAALRGHLYALKTNKEATAWRDQLTKYYGKEKVEAAFPAVNVQK